MRPLQKENVYSVLFYMSLGLASMEEICAELTKTGEMSASLYFFKDEI